MKNCFFDTRSLWTTIWEIKQCHFYNSKKKLFASNDFVFRQKLEEWKICEKAMILAFNNEAARNLCNKFKDIPWYTNTNSGSV